MKLAWLFPILITAVCTMPDRPKATAQTEPEAIPVLVELFTSEGCSSCPPAERFLNEVAAKPERPKVRLIPIAYHVDYWDKLGWKDRFSQAAFTARQYDYRRALGEETVFTPQMIVAGRESFTGSERKTAEKVFASAAVETAVPLLVKVTPQGKQVSVSIAIPEELETTDEDRLYLVWTLSGLKTQIAAGENKGKSLAHEAVALSLTESPVKEVVLVDKPAHEAGGTLQLVVFIQNKDDKHVKAVGTHTIP